MSPAFHLPQFLQQWPLDTLDFECFLKKHCGVVQDIAGLVKSEEDHPTVKLQATMKPIEKQGIGHRLRTEVMSG